WRSVLPSLRARGQLQLLGGPAEIALRALDLGGQEMRRRAARPEAQVVVDVTPGVGVFPGRIVPLRGPELGLGVPEEATPRRQEGNHNEKKATGEGMPANDGEQLVWAVEHVDTRGHGGARPGREPKQSGGGGPSKQPSDRSGAPRSGGADAHSFSSNVPNSFLPSVISQVSLVVLGLA